jgi:hypothetical protein
VANKKFSKVFVMDLETDFVLSGSYTTQGGPLTVTYLGKRVYADEGTYVQEGDLLVVPAKRAPRGPQPKTSRSYRSDTHTPLPSSTQVRYGRNSLLHRCVLRILVEKQNKTTLFKVTVGITKIVLVRMFLRLVRRFRPGV